MRGPFIEQKHTWSAGAIPPKTRKRLLQVAAIVVTICFLYWRCGRPPSRQLIQQQAPSSPSANPSYMKDPQFKELQDKFDEKSRQFDAAMRARKTGFQGAVTPADPVTGAPVTQQPQQRQLTPQEWLAQQKLQQEAERQAALMKTETDMELARLKSVYSAMRVTPVSGQETTSAAVPVVSNTNSKLINGLSDSTPGNLSSKTPAATATPGDPNWTAEELRKLGEQRKQLLEEMRLRSVPKQEPKPSVPPDQKSPAVSPEEAAKIRESRTIFEGTWIDTILQNQINSTYAGPVEMKTSYVVPSKDRLHVLIPMQTKIIGEAKQVSVGGPARIAIVFHRAILPDLTSINLDQFPGTNTLGETGIAGDVNNHYLKIFGLSAALGALSGVTLMGTSNYYGVDESGADYARRGAAAGMMQSAQTVLTRMLNTIPPTVTVRPGERAKVYIRHDIVVDPEPESER